MHYYSQMNKTQLEEYKNKVSSQYEAYKAQNLALDMSRGKPCTEQLDISNEILSEMKTYKTQAGFDIRNYGILDGIPEMKQLFAEILDVSATEVIVGGNSSLNLMYDTFARSFTFGTYGSEMPWSKLEKVRFLCPVPGYDRHFSICEIFGIEMIHIDMQEDGPDMDQVEALIQNDDTIKGIWCVPQYSNPTGIVYSDSVVERLAHLKPKAKDFRIFWDNAYAVHHLYDENVQVMNILDACKKAGNEDMVYIFSSTSKISFPGAGISAIASSINNIEFIKKIMFMQTIGHDKINQLRHVQFFKNKVGVETHMKKHAEILRPKFEAVIEILSKNLSEKGIANWVSPKGGYFISFNVPSGCAKRVVTLAKEAGVTLTGAGATYPYGKDPEDKNIRIAPTFPSLNELKTAIEILCLCVEIAYLEKI